MNLIRNKSIYCALTATLLLYMPTASAQEDDFDHFSISLGVFLTDRASKTRLNGSIDDGDDGTNVDLEGDLGLNRSDTVFRIDGFYRFNEKHRIDISAFDLSRSKTRVIDEEIEWGDTIYPVNVSINSEFDLAIYKLAYTWSFMRRDKGYLGVTAGLYIASFGAKLSAVDIGSVKSDGLTAPLPVVGLRGQYEISEKFSFRASGEIFALEYDDYDGTLVDLYAGIDYQLSEHTALGLGLNSVTLDVGVTKNNFRGNLDWRYDGGLLFLRFDF
jgi:hypothetical protein